MKYINKMMGEEIIYFLLELRAREHPYYWYYHNLLMEFV